MRSRYADGDFWIEAADRAVKCMAAAAVAVFGTNIIRVTDVDWLQTVNIGIFAGIVSVLTSIATARDRPPSGELE